MHQSRRLPALLRSRLRVPTQAGGASLAGETVRGGCISWRHHCWALAALQLTARVQLYRATHVRCPNTQ